MDRPFFLPKSRGEKASPLTKFFRILFYFLREVETHERPSHRPGQSEGRCGKISNLRKSRCRTGPSRKKVLLVNFDSQPSLTISLGHPPAGHPACYPIGCVMSEVLNNQSITPGEGILNHLEGMDLMPLDIQLSGIEVSLVNAMSRETIPRQRLDTVWKQ